MDFYLVSILIRLLTAIFNKLLLCYNWWKFKEVGIVFGTKLKVCGSSKISVSKENTVIGDNFFSNSGLLISTNNHSHIVIKDDVMIGYDVKILGGNHDYTRTKCHMRHISEPSQISRAITINSGVWIGSNSVILSGANIGEGAIIGAGSIVNSDIPPYTIAAGVPAKFIKPRFENQDDLNKILNNTKSLLSSSQIISQYKNVSNK